MKTYLLFFPIALLGLVLGCGQPKVLKSPPEQTVSVPKVITPEEKDWAAIEEAVRVADEEIVPWEKEPLVLYREYVSKYPHGTHYDQANKELEKIYLKQRNLPRIVTLEPRPKGKLVFGACIKQDGPSQIFTINADGTGFKPIAEIKNAAWIVLRTSPNGKWISYFSDYEHLRVIDFQGRIRKILPCIGEGAEPYVWGNDNRLYYTVDFKGIYRYDPQTNTLSRIVPTYEYVLDHHPVPSPSGRQVAYIHHEYGYQYQIRLLSGRTLARGESSELNEEIYLKWIDEHTITCDLGDKGMYNIDTRSGRKTKVADSNFVPFAYQPNNMNLYCDDTSSIYDTSQQKTFKELQFINKPMSRGPELFHYSAFSPYGNDLCLLGDKGIHIYRNNIGSELIFSTTKYSWFAASGIVWVK